MVCDFVTGNIKMTAPIKEEYYINKILRWIGFNTKYQRDIIYNDSINSFSDTMMFTEKVIPDISTEFDGRTQVNGKMNFGVHRTKIMKALIHWVHNFKCISGYRTIFNLKKIVFIQQLDTALYRIEIRNMQIDQYNKKSK